jgi:hypothetical protein
MGEQDVSINFFDEHMVQTLAAERQERLRSDAKEYLLLREIRGNRPPSRPLRQAVGLTIMALGQRVAGASL